MTYGCEPPPYHQQSLYGADVSHSAELVRGDSLTHAKRPFIRPSPGVSCDSDCGTQCGFLKTVVVQPLAAGSAGVGIGA